jgi:hypothetical protein
MRCYLMRGGQIHGVEFLKDGPDEKLIEQAKRYFRGAQRKALKASSCGAANDSSTEHRGRPLPSRRRLGSSGRRRGAGEISPTWIPDASRVWCRTSCSSTVQVASARRPRLTPVR